MEIIFNKAKRRIVFIGLSKLEIAGVEGLVSEHGQRLSLWIDSGKDEKDIAVCGWDNINLQRFVELAELAPTRILILP